MRVDCTSRQDPVAAADGGRAAAAGEGPAAEHQDLGEAAAAGGAAGDRVPADSDEGELETSGPIDSDEESDDEFDNFERVKKCLNATSAAEGCAKLERAAQIFVQLDLEFMNGMHLNAIQVLCVQQLM